MARQGRKTELWPEFQSAFSEFAGLSIQAFDEKGKSVDAFPTLPPLCAFFQRYPETQAACERDCFRKAAMCRETRKIVAERCYAGLSFRIVPIRRRNRLHAVILVGRVLTEVFGGEQCLGFIERYRLSRRSFMESLAGVRTLSGPDLDRIASFLQRLASSFAAVDQRLERGRSQLRRRQELLAVARQAMTFQDRGHDQTRSVLEFLGRLLAVPGSALLLAGEEERRFEVHSSLGLGEDALHVLANQDWPKLFELNGGGTSQVYLPDRMQMLRAGLDLAKAPLAAQRLEHGSSTVGYLVASGAALSRRELGLLNSASAFIAARVVHLKCRERAEQKDEEARLLGLMAEKCLTAQSVDELLPLALEAAMCSLRARRGSIILAEGKGRITAHALRGDHAPISSTMDVIRPDSITHKVFFDRRPILVQDTGREPGLNRERQFPYSSRSFISVPLRQNGHALGVLHLTDREGEEVFTPRDLSMLERLSLQASGAICKARLETEVQALRDTSTTDRLTGLHNRRFLEEQLAIEFQRAIRFGLPLAVAKFDVDEYRAMKDEMGDEYGDSILKQIAGAVRNQLRSVDILARYGEDEFVLVLPGTGGAGAMDAIGKVRKRIEAIALPGDRSCAAKRKLTVSAGLSVYPETAAVAEDLLRVADQSLSLAKKAGRNTSELRTT